MQTHPKIQIEIVASDLTGNLLKREADIAIKMYRPMQADVITRKLGQLGILACASATYIERVGESEGFEQLAELGIIGFGKSTQIIDHMTSRGFMMQRDTFPIRCDNQIVCWKLLQAGAGIGFAQIHSMGYGAEISPGAVLPDYAEVAAGTIF